MRRTLIVLLLFMATYIHAGEIVVQKDGSLHQALRQAREWRRTQDPRCQGGITIRLEAGRYYMNEPLFLRPEDSGTAESPLIIRGDQHAIICGDVPQQHTQLWPKEGMLRLIDFNVEQRTITIPTPPEDVLNMKNLEMVVHQRWAIAILRVKEFMKSNDGVVVTFQEPESRLEFEHPWPQPIIGGERGNSSFLLRTTEQRDGIEQLVIIDGANHVSFEGITFENTCWNRPLHKGHVTLQGGFPLLDAYKLAVPGLPWDNDLENQAWVERPVSAVTIRNVQHVNFDHCQFQHLAATALDYVDNISDCNITCCNFEHIGGTPLMAGSFAESPMEVHRPYTHFSERCQRLLIQGNTIRNATTEDWGAVAISLGYVRDCIITDNLIDGVNYSGICIGWGWTPFDTGMRNNLIYNNNVRNYARQLYDAGGIYTLSNQPGSVIRDNVISQPYPAPYATNTRGFCIYLDARTDGYTIENNKTYSMDSFITNGGLPANMRLIRRDEIGDNHPGPNIIFKQ
ncbi:MAG: right-handed parallel beta-helix repeat-containing protein [Prevotella sp.]|nr:right-handed parallel beta-helix repeat-containing protein [Prevotella sp.]